MKKFKFLSLALAALALGACSSSDDVAEGGGGNSTSYVTVNIRTVSDLPGTRAGEYDAGGGTYEDGEGSESTISSVNFYFFNADGSPYLMNNGAGVTNKATSNSFTDDGKDHDQTIESIKTTLVLSGTGTPKPKYCIAIANDPLSITGTINLADLKQKTTDLASITSSAFTMSNSVYKNSSDAIVTEQDIEAAVQSTPEAANANPVNIYIERVAAKVNTSILTTGTDWTESAGVYKIKVGLTAGSEDVYAVVKGWGVADGKKLVWMTKNLSTSYTLNFTPWNSDENNFHRSFWANTYDGSGQAVVNSSWNQYTTAIGTAIYTNENTPTVAYDPATIGFYNGNQLSKVLVAAQLVDASGNPVELCTYRGVEYLSADAVKTQILTELQGKFRKNTGGGTADLDASDLQFKTQKSLGASAPSGMKNYEVTVRLASTLTLEKYDGASWVSATENDLNTQVDKAFAQIRTSGDAYYYIPISHLGARENKLGAFGVVRNHSYKVTINDMKGFGTPVYDPDEEITPTIPDDEKVYLAAKINVLSWRVVKSTVNLDKTN